MVTITLLILFERKKYNDEIYPALKQLKSGDIKSTEKLADLIDKQIVVDFWDFSDIPEEESEFTDFFEDFVLALEDEISKMENVPFDLDKATLRKMIVDIVKGTKNIESLIPEEIIKRISLSNQSLLESLKNEEINVNTDYEEEIGKFDIDDTDEEDVSEVDILSNEMQDILNQVKEDKQADADAMMYFKARFIEGFCIPVKKVKYRFDLTGNLLNVFIYSISPQAKEIVKDIKNAITLLPTITESEKEFAEDIFDRYLDNDKIIKFMAILDNITLTLNIDSEFNEIDKLLTKNIKGEWWNRMKIEDKRKRVNNWWQELESLKMFLQGALDHGYDILIAKI